MATDVEVNPHCITNVGAYCGVYESVVCSIAVPEEVCAKAVKSAGVNVVEGEEEAAAIGGVMVGSNSSVIVPGNVLSGCGGEVVKCPVSKLGDETAALCVEYYLASSLP